MDDVFGFCSRHIDGMHNVSNWCNGYVMHLRGDVIKVVQCLPEECKEDKADNRRADLKQRLLNIMNQKNMVCYADQWEEIFEEVAKEFHILKVLNG
jgi:hypothetical protein